MKRLTYTHTIYASYIAYVVQAVVVNFAPLLFVTFSEEYGISLDKLAFMITLNFMIQLTMDFLAAKFLDKIGYRTAFVGAHLLAALGFILMGILPDIMPAFTGLIISTVLIASGGGLIEVTASPIVEAVPVTSAKSAAMSLLHSFYCWGQLFTVLASTLFFVTVGIEHWRILSFLWAIIPIINSVFCLTVPINTLKAEKGASSIRQLFKNKLFLLLLVFMLASGATELAVSQWASALAETGLGVSKTVGDLLGPSLFALCMGTVRALYAKISQKLKMENALLFSGIIGVVGYLLTCLSPFPWLSLVGCGLCGIASALLWPGVISLGAKAVCGGTAMFSLLALAGDLGCGVGPGLTGFMADIMNNNLKSGILVGIIFPIIIILSALSFKKMTKNR